MSSSFTLLNNINSEEDLNINNKNESSSNYLYNNNTSNIMTLNKFNEYLLIESNQTERQGDWICIKCFNLNYSFRFKCNRCLLSKEEHEAIKNETNNYYNELLKSNIIMSNTGCNNPDRSKVDNNNEKNQENSIQSNLLNELKSKLEQNLHINYYNNYNYNNNNLYQLQNNMLYNNSNNNMSITNSKEFSSNQIIQETKE